MLLRRLLDGERIEHHEGRFYTLRDALVEPRPLQPRLPILIGGSGPQKTLRTTARYANAWNASGGTRSSGRRTRSFASDAPRSAGTTRRSSGPATVWLHDPRRRGARPTGGWRRNAVANGTR